MSELTVILKGNDTTTKQKFLLYDNYTIDHNDSTIQSCINETKKNFSGHPEEVIIKITFRTDIQPSVLQPTVVTIIGNA